MSAAYVREAYGVELKVGDRVVLQEGTRHERRGVVVSFPDQYVGVRFDGEKRTSRCHPTWKLERDQTAEVSR